MSSLIWGAVVFACIFGGGMLGMFVSPMLPDAHSSPNSRDVVRLGMGVVGTTVALVLGLLVGSAKNFYDTQNNEVTQLAANAVLLDRVLAHYGPDAADTRAALRTTVARWLENLEPGSSVGRSEALFDKIQALSSTNAAQTSLKAQASSLAIQLGQTRWLMFEQKTVPFPKLLLFMLISWLTALFLSFGLFAPRNFTVKAGLLISALAVSGAIFLILDMYQPYGGLTQVSDAPLRAATAQLGQ
jgi:hypothetical protein